MRFTVPLLLVFTVACASAPTVVPVVAPSRVPDVTWDQKLGWLMRLEDQRVLADPHPPARRVLAPATPTRPEVLAAVEPTDILPLLADGEARVRRRAALAAGRVGLAPAVPGLINLLADAEHEVRQVAAFSLGLIGDAAGADALSAALRDPHPIVQGRAAEALGRIGRRQDAAAVAAMVRAHVDAGALADLSPDDERVGQGPADAVRLGAAALARLGSWEALASALLDPRGVPVSSWWPVASAFQRVQDPRAVPALRALLATPSRYTRVFAIQGLGALKAREAASDLQRIVTAVPLDRGPAVEALKALRQIGDGQVAPAVLGLASDGRTERAFRVAALETLAALPAQAGTVEALLDLVSEPDPYVRAEAFRTLAHLDADAFLAAVASMDADRNWAVRAAQADGLGAVGARAVPALLSRMADPDQRVVAPVITALAATGAPEAVAPLVTALGLEDLAVRAAAARGLARLKATAAVPRLRQAYEAWRTELPYVARAAALEALVALDPSGAPALLTSALGDRDWAVRTRASELARGVPGAVTAEALAGARPAPASRAVSEDEWRWLLAPPYSPHARLELERGTVELELDVVGAPQTVASFMALARKGFFDGMAVHRVVPNFVVQAGDPRGDGEGGPGYTLRDELSLSPYLRGTVGMALDWRDTGGSQFFITLGPQPHLDGRYTTFGSVVDGMSVVEQIQQGDVIRRVTVWDGRDAR